MCPDSVGCRLGVVRPFGQTVENVRCLVVPASLLDHPGKISPLRCPDANTPAPVTRVRSAAPAVPYHQTQIISTYELRLGAGHQHPRAPSVTRSRRSLKGSDEDRCRILNQLKVPGALRPLTTVSRSIRGHFGTDTQETPTTAPTISTIVLPPRMADPTAQGTINTSSTRPTHRSWVSSSRMSAPVRSTLDPSPQVTVQATRRSGTSSQEADGSAVATAQTGPRPCARDQGRSPRCLLPGWRLDSSQR